MKFIPLPDLIYRCAFTHVVYCIAGGHYLVRLDAADRMCPIGCNT